MERIKTKWLKLGLLLLAALAMWWLGRPQPSSVNEADQKGPLEPVMSNATFQAVQEAKKQRMETEGGRLPGEEILEQYGKPGTRPEDDLHAMAHAFGNLALLVKGGSPFRMGANEEFAAALMGKNAAKMVFLAPPHACLNDAGQVVDRWGTPLFFHVRDAVRTDIRSAGPDKTMWTADDLQRQADGQFMHGSKLPETER